MQAQEIHANKKQNLHNKCEIKNIYCAKPANVGRNAATQVQIDASEGVSISPAGLIADAKVDTNANRRAVAPGDGVVGNANSLC